MDVFQGGIFFPFFDFSGLFITWQHNSVRNKFSYFFQCVIAAFWAFLNDKF